MHYKWFLIGLILFSPLVQAKLTTPKTILACLGQEELNLHRNKTRGPIYDLNQTFISELTSVVGVNIKEDELRKICRYKPFTPSVNFLRSLLVQREKLFALNKINQQNGKDAYRIQVVKDLVQKGPHLMFRYLAYLQGLTSRHDCLRKRIPNLYSFLEKYYFLEKDYSMTQLIDDTQKINLLFKKLENFNSMAKACEEEHQLLLKKELLKTQKE